jgi:hypothetical protein
MQHGSGVREAREIDGRLADRREHTPPQQDLDTPFALALELLDHGLGVVGPCAQAREASARASPWALPESAEAARRSEGQYAWYARELGELASCGRRSASAGGRTAVRLRLELDRACRRERLEHLCRVAARGEDLEPAAGRAGSCGRSPRAPCGERGAATSSPRRRSRSSAI